MTFRVADMFCAPEYGKCSMLDPGLCVQMRVELLLMMTVECSY